MKVDVLGHEAFISTGGREFNADGPVLMFIHGSGQSHLSYLLQGRFFANRGWSVLVPDMPAHGLSAGEPLTSIADMANWHIALMDVLGVKQAHLIGHSQGGLVSLEMACHHANRVVGISQISTALSIPVNDALIAMAKDKEPAAIAAMTDWGHGIDGHRHDHTMPGQDHMNYGKQLMAANQSGALYADLSACAAYHDGAAAAARITCPTQCIIAEKDKMTPMKAGLKLASALGVEPTIVAGAGHMLPSERPLEVNSALRSFIGE